MQQAVITGLDLQRPEFVRTEKILFHTVQIRGTAAFEDEGLRCH